jgi:signal transduction histidine kinase
MLLAHILTEKMFIIFLLLYDNTKESVDSTFKSLQKVSPETFLSLSNPVMFSLIFLIVTLFVSFVYYRYVIIPLRQRFLEEKENIKLQQAELMALFYELSPDPILRFDVTGKIIVANKAAQDIFGNNILLGQYIENVITNLSSFNLGLLVNSDDTQSFYMEVNNRAYEFLIKGVPKYQFGQVYGRDITKLKEAEDDLKFALVQAEKAKRLKEEFLSRISHEIRSPLVAIQGYSELIKNELEGEFSPEFRQIFQSIENNSKRLYRTVDLILNMSQVYTTSYESNFKVINIYKIIDEVFMNFSSFADEKNINYKFISNIGENIQIVGDEYSIKQIYDNVIDNAFKYTAKGEVKITLDKINGKIKTIIQDTGRGMSNDFIEQLFQPFTQEFSGYTRLYDGAGVGLALVKNFVELNKGEIVVKSNLGEGTKFTISFNEA